jgi:hypothetical protein
MLVVVVAAGIAIVAVTDAVVALCVPTGVAVGPTVTIGMGRSVELPPPQPAAPNAAETRIARNEPRKNGIRSTSVSLFT